MRASPACQVVLKRFGAWRGAVSALTAVSILCVIGWLASRDQPASVIIIVLALSTCLAIIVLLVSLLRMPRRLLRWDGQLWHLAESPGELAVVVDLGPWMLLRFVANNSKRVVWLPAQRRGLETEWHALRCAVYSPRPVVPL